LQRAEAYRFEVFDINLIFAAGFVDADGAAHGHLQAVFGAELDAALLLFEEDAADLGAIVFQREVDVARLRFAAIGDFAYDPDVGEILGQEVADASGKLTDSENAARRLEVELELSSHGLNRQFSVDGLVPSFIGRVREILEKK